MGYLRRMTILSATASPAPVATAFDAVAFRRALGAFVTGITIITTVDADGTPAGLTANSFNSVSLDPPMVLWSLALDSTSLAAFRQAKWWAVHVLHAGQQDLSNRFAKREGDKFIGLDLPRGPGGVPLLEEYAARFICRAAFEYEGGDHAIFLGAVEEFDQAPLTPLVYHRGRYGGVLPAGEGPSEQASLAALEARGLIEYREDRPRLTDEGREIAVGLVALAEAAPASLTPHEVAALRHLLPRVG
jgi:3-hydroxy-9,10-secoandrosta-1,3,5(10)-triene-9,17-dione monooxygenase reductase component